MAPHTRSSHQRSTPWRVALLVAITLGVFMLCASVVIAASSTASQAPELVVEGERTMQGAKLALRGTKWPARASLIITASPPPGTTAALDLGTAQSDADGEFRATKLSRCTTNTAPPQSAQVTVTVQSGTAKAEQKLDAALWHCMTDN